MANQKLSIYLLKNTNQSFEDCIKEPHNFKIININKNGKLFYKKTEPKIPDWVEFFKVNNNNSFTEENIEYLKSSTSSGIYILKIENRDLYFGIAFGHGWQYFSDDIIIENFGIKTALNIIKKGIKKIEKRSFTNGLKDVIEQRGQIGEISDFGFDVEQDVMKSIVGETKPIYKPLFGKSVVGKDAITLSTEIKIDGLNNLLIELYKAYEKDDYKENFNWFDKLSLVKDKKLIENLNSELIRKIKNIEDEEVLWAAVPEIIEWQDFDCFIYNNNNNNNNNDDIDLIDFLKTLNNDDKDNINIELLKSKKIKIKYTNDTPVKEWSILKCIYTEIDYENKKYLFVSEKYYKIDSAFKDEIEKEVLVSTEISLPPCNYSNERDYNNQVAESDKNFICMDIGVNQNNSIKFGYTSNGIEFADLFDKNQKRIIHVKHYGSSAVLGHLFNQGFVSGNLLKKEKEFRKEVNRKIRLINVDKFDAKKITIVFAVISKRELKLPFFASVVYRNIKKNLEAFGFNVKLIRIEKKINN